MDVRTEKVRLTDWHNKIKEITKQLDQTNIRILSTMSRYGPRNLLEVSRRTKIPFTSVYHRVAKLEAKTRRVSYLVPRLSKLGLMGFVVYARGKPRVEEKLTAAMKIPKWWRSLNFCEGPFTHCAFYAIPARFNREFRKYLRMISEMKLVTELKIYQTGDIVPNFPNFSYYNPNTKEWTFPWDRWLTALQRTRPSKRIEDPDDYTPRVDRKDIMIVRELERSARKSFAELSPLLGISLQGVKYHFDKKLVPAGIVDYFAFEVIPYPVETSAYYEIMLEFTGGAAMNKFYSACENFFFIQSMTKVLNQNILVLRTYIPQSQAFNQLAFFSQMAKERILESYSTLRLDFTRRESQTVLPELFDEDTGWIFNLKKYASELSKLRRV